MPNKPSDYVSENPKRVFLEPTITTGQAPVEGSISFEPGKHKTGNPGKTVPLANFASDQASYTGPQQGFFSKFGSNSTGDSTMNNEA